MLFSALLCSALPCFALNLILQKVAFLLLSCGQDGGRGSEGDGERDGGEGTIVTVCMHGYLYISIYVYTYEIVSDEGLIIISQPLVSAPSS